MEKLWQKYQALVLEQKNSWHFSSYPYVKHLLFLVPIIILALTYACLIADFEAGKILKNNYQSFTSFMKLLSNYGNWIFYVFYAGIFIQAYLKQEKSTIYFILRFIFWQILIALILVFVLKNGLGFSRPLLLGAPAQPLAFDYAYQSFPSGHTTEIFLLALALGLFYNSKLIYFSACLMATLVAFSRIWLQAHYPIDIIGGIILASFGTYCIFKKVK